MFGERVFGVGWWILNGGYRERLFEHVFCSLRSHGTRDKAGSIIDGGYRERVSAEVFCSLRSHGTRFAYGRLRAQALSQPCLVMESKRLIQESRLWCVWRML